MGPAEYLSLAQLIAPVGRERFLAEFWETKPLVVARGEPSFYQDLLTLEDTDRVLTTLHLSYPDIRLAKDGEPPKTDDYTFAGGRIDPLAVAKLFGAGATIVFNQMQRRLPALAALVRGLETEIGTAFQTNLYLSPPNSGGFKVHYDTHDVFVLQIAGAKEWELFESPIALPMPGQHHDEMGCQPGAVTRRFTLRAGDAAYIPRGIYHKACASDQVSLHITLGALVRSWSEVLLEAMAELSLRDVAFRRAVPLGFGTGEFDRAEAEKQFRELARRFAEAADFTAAASSFNREFIQGRDAGLRDQLLQVARLGQLSGDSVVVARSGRVLRFESKDDRVDVHYLNTLLTFPAHAEASLRSALSGTPVRVRDIAGELDEAGKLVLARRLIEEGLLVAESPTKPGDKS